MACSWRHAVGVNLQHGTAASRAPLSARAHTHPAFTAVCAIVSSGVDVGVTEGDGGATETDGDTDTDGEVVSLCATAHATRAESSAKRRAMLTAGR